MISLRNSALTCIFTFAVIIELWNNAENKKGYVIKCEFEWDYIGGFSEEIMFMGIHL